MTEQTILQVTTTVDSADGANVIAQALIEKRLAACVQVSGPVKSVYHWQGKIESAEEWQCAAKTLQSKYGEVERVIRESHTYDEPEIIATEVVTGSQSYLDWVRRECSAPAN